MSNGEGVRFFQKNILSKNIIFAIYYQGNATICLLQPKFWVETIYPRITGTTSLLDL